MKPNTKDRKRRGSVLYLALLFIAVINMLALAYVKAIPTESNSFLRSQRALKAHYACEAGIFDSMAWITFELANGREPTESGVVTRTGTHDGWTWRATIESDAESPPSGSSSLRFYEVQSEAFIPGSPTVARRIRATMGEETFARLSNFVDVFPPGVYMHLLSGGAFIEGHTHTNTYFSMLPTAARYASNNDPSYKGYVTSAKIAPNPWGFDGVDYVDPDMAPYDGAQVPIAPRYERLFLGGRAGLNTGVNRIELPANSLGLEVRAWGEDVPRPVTPGVHINVDGEIKGGILVNGEIQDLLLESLGDASKVTITQDVGGVIETTVIVEGQDGGATLGGQGIGTGQTAVQWPDTTVTVFEGIPNGVIHSTGSILSLRGTNRGERLISADLGSNQTVTITSDVLRADTPQGSRPTGSRDVLGIVTHKLIIGNAVPRDPGDPLYLYFSYLCGKEEPYPTGGLEVEDYYDTGRGRGSYYLYGSAGAGRQNATGSSSPDTGFGFRQYFDKYLLDHPPPYYPTTGKLPIRSWREEDGNL